jgi:hypothetical protein
MNQKRTELINFIKWKLRDEDEYLKQVLPKLQEYEYQDLKSWAITNDIID